MQHSQDRRAGVRSFRQVAAIALATISLIALAGCRPAVSAGPPTGAPVEGGTATFAVALDALPSGIFKTLETNYPWLYNVFEPLMTVDPTDPANPKPVLATAWKVAADGLSIDLTLRDDVTFQTGRPMTADDVKFSFEQAALPVNASTLRFVPAAFTSMTVVNPTTLHIEFKAAQPSLFDFFSQTPIVDQETFAGLADGTQIVGTGPYSFTDWKVGASFTLKKYDGYWNADKVHLDEIDYVVTTDATALLSALRSGRAQIAMGLTATDAASFAKDSQYVVQQTGGTFYTLGMDTTVAPFDNPKVRQAVAYALDRDRINAQVLAGTGYVSDFYWAPKTPGVDDSLVTHYSYDVEQAKKLIKDAGATGASVPIMFNSNPVVKAIYEVVANNLTEIGLVPVAKQVDQPTFQAAVSAVDYGAAWLQNTGQGGLSPVTMLNSMPTLRLPNGSKFDSPEYDTLRDALSKATTDDARNKALQKLSQFMLDEQWVAPIIQAPSALVNKSTLQGITFSPRGPVLLGTAYLTK
jgi:peptide/nickel transport system substrate-binding protein